MSPKNRILWIRTIRWFNDYMQRIVWIVGIISLLSIITSMSNPLGYDETDDREKGIRSNMIMFTDHGTGCQYLGRAFGGLTPRLDIEGKPICQSQFQ